MGKRKKFNDMSQSEYIAVQLDRKTFGVIFNTFVYMRDHFNDPMVIDQTSLMMTEKEVDNVVQKLEPYNDSSQDNITIAMNDVEWTNYYGLLAHTSSAIPQETPENYDILDELLMTYADMDDEETSSAEPDPS